MRLHMIPIFVLLTSALFAGGVNVSAVGRDGVSYYSTDSGVTWQTANSNTSVYLFGVAADERSNFWAVGAKGVVLKSEDYGASYRVVHELTEKSFHAIDIDQQGRIAIVGDAGLIYVSHDLGNTFDSVGPGTRVNLLDINIDNPKQWLAVGVQGRIFTSRDSGRTWVAIEELSGASNFNAITYTASGTFIVGGTLGALFTSKDGYEWIPRVIAEGYKGVIEDLASDSSDTVYAAAWDGVFRSGDQGQTWTKVNTGSSQRPMAITASGSRIVTVGFRSTIVSGAENEWLIHDDLGRKHLQDVAPNDLPDLAIQARRLDGCRQIEITVTNRGPGHLTKKPYADSAVGVLLSSGSSSKHLHYISLADLDPGEKLRNEGVEITHTFDIDLSDPLRAQWGLNGIVMDRDLSNNGTTIGECKSK